MHHPIRPASPLIATLENGLPVLLDPGDVGMSAGQRAADFMPAAGHGDLDTEIGPAGETFKLAAAGIEQFLGPRRISSVTSWRSSSFRSGLASALPRAAAMRFPLAPPLRGTVTAAPFLYVPDRPAAAAIRPAGPVRPPPWPRHRRRRSARCNPAPDRLRGRGLLSTGSWQQSGCCRSWDSSWEGPAWGSRGQTGISQSTQYC